MGWREGDRRQAQRKWAQALETRVWVSELPRSHLEGVGSGNIKLELEGWLGSKLGLGLGLGLAPVGTESQLQGPD